VGTPRIQFQFQDVSDSIALGWTENWYAKTAAGSAIILSTLASPAIVNARLSLMGTDYRLSQIRAYGTDRNDVSVRNYPGNGGIGQFPPPTPAVRTSEQPWDAVLISIAAAISQRRNFAMRGIPSGVFLDTFTVASTPTWLANFDIWKAAVLATNAYAFRATSYTLATPIASALVQEASRGLQVQVVHPAPGAFVRGAVVRVRGMQGASPVNHLWRIRDVTVGVINDSLNLQPARRTIFGAPVVGTGFLDLVTYTTGETFAGMAVIRGMKRNTGRPPALLRGRASARRT
jgi:hypothetical protein